MKAVEHDPEIVAVGGADNLPGDGPVLNPAPPGERLIANSHTALTGKVGEFGEVLGRTRGVVDRVRRNIGAHTQQARTELVHEVKLPRRPLEVPRPGRLEHRLEVKQRLEGDDRKPEIGSEQPRVAWLAAEGGQIVFKDLDRAKARLGCGGEFVLESAAHADRGGRPPEHSKTPLSLVFLYLAETRGRP